MHFGHLFVSTIIHCAAEFYFFFLEFYFVFTHVLIRKLF